MPDLVLLKILTIYTNCQPFIYYFDPGAGPAHINCPSAERIKVITSCELAITCMRALKEGQNQLQMNLLLAL